MELSAVDSIDLERLVAFPITAVRPDSLCRETQQDGGTLTVKPSSSTQEGAAQEGPTGQLLLDDDIKLQEQVTARESYN